MGTPFPRVVDYRDNDDVTGMNSTGTIDLYTKVMAPGRLAYKQWAKQALNLLPQANTIVDVGTGPGFLAIPLAKLSGKKVVAVDLSPNMLKKAEARAAKAGVEIQAVRANCKSLPFKDASVDLITSSHLIHMIEDVLPFFRELKRISRPGGKALIIDYRRDTLSIIHKFADFHSNVVLRDKPLSGMGPVIKASFTKEELLSLLHAAGIKSYTIKTGILLLKLLIGF